MPKITLAGNILSASQKFDNTEAQLLLGQIALNNGSFVEAFNFFSIAAQSGQAHALNMLGRAYEKGWGVPRSAPLAMRYFEAAAIQGYGWAYFNLGDLYLAGDGLLPNPVKAFECYVKAACHGVNKALNMLGTLCETGVGTQLPDKEKARQYFLAGAHVRDCWAAFNLGRLYMQEKDQFTAALWFEASLAYGYPGYWSFIHQYLIQNESQVFRKIQGRVERLLLKFP
ncbi:tetratricopeptide repeat protein [Acetobacter cibinongensis]|uniref:tetratricopeptide repeat protein n=1 Tax=Acetobacter cibinongensis TaxID=146475 RepID=UPI000A3CC63B|nr:tetratricopeptide repeat protein [Acetobacter cibinongensis]